VNNRATNRICSFSTIILFVFFLVVASSSVRASAQSTTGSIYGSVSDDSGAVVPHAAVTVTEISTNSTRTVNSSASGDYVFPSLTPGSYSVTIKISGFQSQTQTGIRLDANQNIHVNFALKPGSVDETVEVTASTTLVDTRESQLGSTVDQKRLEELPLNGRDAYDLVQISPGIANYSQAQNSPYVGDVAGATFSTNGLRLYENSAYLDGANDTSVYRPGLNYAPNPDALQEFRILTSTFDAEFGTKPGAVVNMITRSGTNDIHGLAYDFLRNNIFNARSYFNSSITHLRQNQFGGNLGGPILHNKLFLFGSYQGLRIATQVVLTPGASIVPTAAERAGDFSADKTIPKCGTTTFPCGGTPGVIPTALLDPVVQNMLKSIPLPSAFNGISGGPTPQQVGAELIVSNQYLIHGDYHVNDKHRLSGMYFTESGSQPYPNAINATILGYSGDLVKDTQTNSVGTDTWTISPNKLNSLRLYYTGNHYQAADLYAGTNTLASLGITIPCAATPCTQPNVTIPGYIGRFGNNGSAPNTVSMSTYGGGDTFNWSLGRHTLKLGGSFARNQYAPNQVAQRSGVYTVSGYATGNPLADFVLGKASNFSQNNSYPVNLHQIDPSLFGQDDWQVTKRLTLNLGLRWEVFRPYHGENNLSSFVPNMQSTVIPTAPTGLVFSGDPGVPDGILQTTYDKFAPRVGFAYDVFGGGRTSLRGGWGLFYSTVAASFYSNLLSPVYGKTVSISNPGSFANPYQGSTTPVDPFPFTPNLTNPTFSAGLSFAGEPPNNKAVPYVMEYNLTLEQQFGSHWATSISYVGNGGRKFYANRDENAPVYSPSCTAATCGTAATQLARRPYKPSTTSYVFGIIGELDPATNSNFNSLQVLLTRSFSHGFSVNASYVWSKALSDGTDDTAISTTTFPVSDSYNFRTDYGKSSFSQPQRFVVSYLYATPDIKRFGFAGKELLSGWRLSGITTLASGLPFNIVAGSDTNFDGNPLWDRPNQIGNPYLPKGRSRAARAAQYFNIAAFAPIPAGTSTGLGNTQYDLLVGPGQINTDFSATKSFTIVRETRLEFRAEAFNLFGNVNFGNPTAQQNSSQNGIITTTTEPGRILQFALKLAF
jgi:hypothetical protein